MKRSLLRLFFICFSLLSLQVWADPSVASGQVRKKAKHKVVLTKGTLFMLSPERRTQIWYARKYSKQGKSLFRTEYTIYNEQKKLLASVQADHDKRRKVVTVSVKDLTSQGFPTSNIESDTYSDPFPGPFGHIGKVGAANKSNPGQMMVRFANKRYDYVQVLSIADAHEDPGKKLQVYVLDRK
ncbi:hypothetical protein [Rurimicrobium arvi]|uniref:Uncharacterized protein n=1 Tax=Rurimicrobium arvi TaxID=2049916 RepID=A0ABP8N381_9BACT